ncbi:MAG: Type 1 glutamine amidotransferase-like domain-containing protein [Woeseiaceae bacterium]
MLTYVTLFRPFGRPEDVGSALLTSDVIYVAGGNTRALIAVWREYGIDIAFKAWQAGVVLAGLSSGAICWFEEGHTDSSPGGLSKMVQSSRAMRSTMASACTLSTVRCPLQCHPVQAQVRSTVPVNRF